jgi:hypothetical protein
MSKLTCPHCYNEIPYGATVCCGCQAEVRYGPPSGLLGAVVVIPILIGLFVIQGIDGLLLGVIVGIGLGFALKKAMKSRVVFSRHYRSR